MSDIRATSFSSPYRTGPRSLAGPAAKEAGSSATNIMRDPTDPNPSTSGRPDNNGSGPNASPSLRDSPPADSRAPIPQSGPPVGRTAFPPPGVSTLTGLTPGADDPFDTGMGADALFDDGSDGEIDDAAVTGRPEQSSDASRQGAFSETTDVPSTRLVDPAGPEIPQIDAPEVLPVPATPSSGTPASDLSAGSADPAGQSRSRLFDDTSSLAAADAASRSRSFLADRLDLGAASADHADLSVEHSLRLADRFTAQEQAERDRIVADLKSRDLPTSGALANFSV